VQGIAHEAGHTFGLAHVRTEGSDPDPLVKTTNPDVMSYDSPRTFFQDSIFHTTAYNYHPDSGKNELTGTVPHWTYYEEEVYPWGVVEVPHEHEMLTQNSFTYLTQVLGPRPVGAGKDDFANVSHAGSVTPGWLAAGKDGAVPNLSAWSTTAGS